MEATASGFLDKKSVSRVYESVNTHQLISFKRIETARVGVGAALWRLNRENGFCHNVHGQGCYESKED
jgi:hypothetical protein